MLIFDYRPMGTRSTVLSNSPTFSSFSFCRRCKIVTGIMMSPALAARFPWFPGIFGGRQAARSLHFIGLILFVGFIVIHICLVVAHGFAREMAKIVLGAESLSCPRCHDRIDRRRCRDRVPSLGNEIGRASCRER